MFWFWGIILLSGKIAKSKIVFVSKIISTLSNPLGLFIVLFLIVIVLHQLRQQRLANFLVVLATIQLWVFSTPLTANYFTAKLERLHLPKPIEVHITHEFAIVLGGAVSGAYAPRIYSDFGDASDRLMHAFRLYKAGKAKKIILSGGFIDYLGASVSESSLMKEIFMQWGVPEIDLILDEQSKNTYENAIFTKQLVDSITNSPVLLVTSALHMKRAKAVFKKQGLNVIATPTDYLVTDNRSSLVFELIPNPESLVLTSSTIKEHIGYFYYWLREWV